VLVKPDPVAGCKVAGDRLRTARLQAPGLRGQRRSARRSPGERPEPSGEPAVAGRFPQASGSRNHTKPGRNYTAQGRNYTTQGRNNTKGRVITQNPTVTALLISIYTCTVYIYIYIFIYMSWRHPWPQTLYIPRVSRGVHLADTSFSPS
jgi:hypothetical protein